ncbi:Protein ycf2 [Talaromyces islandicus]|uniref:Protein ycf2 n=1 Tax=Talaromyces islandicus TaxID=28573 RepID=A0A0U1M0R9_TALIS|nr:Protein ycf2 [Talaromyces islandicus]
MSLLLYSDVNALHKASKAKLMHMNIRYENKNYEGDFSQFRYAEETDVSELPLIPSPGLFRSLHSMTAEVPLPVEQRVPTVGHCAVHLELLEVFFSLRHKIINSRQLDDAFGVKVIGKIVYRKKYNSKARKYIIQAITLRDDTFKARRREILTYYLSIAVECFKVWIEQADEVMFEECSSFSKKPALPCLPPLDVLMCNSPDTISLVTNHEWTFEVSTETNDWTTKVANKEPDLFVYLQRTSTIPNSISRALRKYTNSNVPIGSMLDYLKDFDLSQREKFFLKLLLNIQTEEKTKKLLIDNEQRQASFVDKMHDHLWICRPAAEGTLRRAIDRYHRFLKFFQLYPGKMLVPTLDIDLVWHTHQCSASSYENSMRERTGRYIDHDDRIGKTRVHGGMDETQKLFRLRFGQEYPQRLTEPYDPDTFATAFFPVAKELEAKAAQAEITGNVKIASQLYLRAAALYRIARFPIARSSKTFEAWTLGKAAYMRASPYLDPINTEVTIPHTNADASAGDGNTIRAYLRLPPHASAKEKVPVVLFICGLDAYRTDHTSRTSEHVRRGFACLSTEIPGTGDCPAAKDDPTSPDRLWSSVLDWIETQDIFDKNKVCVRSISTGGYYGMRIAHTHAGRLVAAVSQGGGSHRMFSPEWIDSQNKMEYPYASVYQHR